MRSKLLQSMTSVIALLALSAFVAGGALAQDSKPTIRGNFGAAFGWKTIDGLDFKATTDPESESSGIVQSIEANLFFEGSNGPMSYQFRYRMRGQDNQNVDGKSNLFAGKNIQVFRGYVRWAVADNFDITIGKYGGTPVSSATENDPVQLFPTPLFTGSVADSGIIDFRAKYAGGIAGVILTNQTAGNLSTDGTPLFDGGRGGIKNADDENLSIVPYGKVKVGGIGIGASVAISSGTMNEKAAVAAGAEVDCKGIPPGDPCISKVVAGADAVPEGDFDAVGIGLYFDIPLGGLGKLLIDFETATSDLDPSFAPATEEESIGFGALLILGGFRAGFAQLVQEVGPVEFTQTNINAHFRIPVGKKGYWAPEVQMQTKEDDTKTGVGEVDEEEQTVVRVIFQIGF